MRKLILKMSMSLDGFVAGPHGEIDWLFRSQHNESTAWIVEEIGKAGIHIMGSKTFHDMVAWWPTSTEPFAAPMNEIPKGVFTQKGLAGGNPDLVTHAVQDAQKAREQRNESTVPAPSSAKSWEEARVFSGDLTEEIKKLKQEPGKDIIAHGGASFARSLVATGLIDEYQLLVHPVALGAGLPLFSSLRKPLDLNLIEIKTFPSGAAAHIYR
jgi:dihydrofolate reductase